MNTSQTEHAPTTDDVRVTKSGQAGVLKVLGVVLAAVVAFFVVVVAVGASMSPATPADPASSSSATTEDTPAAAAAAATLPDALKSKYDDRFISAAVVAGQVEIEFKIADNLTNNLIRTGAQRDTKIALQAAHTTNPGMPVNIMGLFPMRDGYGDTADKVALRVLYTPGVIAKINFDTILSREIWPLADVQGINPGLRDN